MTEQGDLSAIETRTDGSTTSPLVFISHDTRDAALAEAFGKLLSSVSAGMLKTFRSSDRRGSQGFEYGVEWYPELMKRLESACDVVCILTERSLGRPWILYEAGVAKGRLSIAVHGLALGVPLAKASVGPFAQFQNCDDDDESLVKLVMQLVRRLPNAEPDEETVQAQVAVFKSKVSTALEQAVSADIPHEAEAAEASTAKLFEEVKVMFQDLPARIEKVANRPVDRSSRRRAWLSRTADLARMLAESREEFTALLVLAVGAQFRDDFPLLYELSLQVYRTADSAAAVDRRAFENALDKFLRCFEILDRRGLEIGGLDPVEFDHIMREISHAGSRNRRDHLSPRAKDLRRSSEEPKAAEPAAETSLS